VQEPDHDAAGRGRAQPLTCPDHACLHLREALPARETEPRWTLLDDLPLRKPGEGSGPGTCPLVEITLSQPGKFTHRESGAFRCGGRSLASPLSWWGVGDIPVKALETQRKPVGLFPAVVAEVQVRGPAGQHHAGRRGLAVAHQQ